MNAIARPALARHFHRIAWLAVALTACVVVFGAFVRLSDAGLSCPDWPTCYGRATWPSAPQDAATHAASEIRPFETHKAWREQVHRHLAASLGVLVLLLALLALVAGLIWQRWSARAMLGAAAGAVGVLALMVTVVNKDGTADKPWAATPPKATGQGNGYIQPSPPNPFSDPNFGKELTPKQGG